MKESKKIAERWFKQARHDLGVAKCNLKNGFYADSCFMAEQSAQKAIKAYLYFQGTRFIPEHSVAKLIEECKNRDFGKIVKYGHKLDQYYIPTRYPDALLHQQFLYKELFFRASRRSNQICRRNLKIN